MTWQAIKTQFSVLTTAIQEGADLSDPWSAFVKICRETESAPPYHIADLFDALERYRGDRPRDDVAILDHGCGSGLTLFYLAALGYQNVYGVDVEIYPFGDRTPIFECFAGPGSNRYRVYDGITLPFEESRFDVVFSQQVLEHVQEHVLSTFYSEESRVLVNGGIALHSVPHRLVPYEAHTRTWFLHWFLPRRAWSKVLDRLGISSQSWMDEWLHLRWPWVHRRLARQHFGHCEDRTFERLARMDVGEYYDGPKGIRVKVTQAIRTPVIGALLGRLAANFVMLDTLSIKKR